MNACSLFQTFINAIITTLGAFVPIFFLMYVHYKIRKIKYLEEKKRLIEECEIYQKLVDINDEVIQKIYTSAKVTSFQELLDDPQELVYLDKFQYMRMVTYVNEQLNEKLKKMDRMNEMTVSIMYINSYNFGVYLATLLDKRFPDKGSK
jgi:hypothetical protein